MHIARPNSAASMTRLWIAAETSEPSYPQRGATLTGELPVGYHHVAQGTVLGQGRNSFAKASEGLRTWRAHRFCGVQVFPPDAPLLAGATVIVTLGTRVGAIVAPCRIMTVIDEPGRFGFVYGTLPGHPEQGEESFMVSIAEDGIVRFDIRAFSRPGDPLTRCAGPIGRTMQSIATKAYLRSLRRFVGTTDSYPG